MLRALAGRVLDLHPSAIRFTREAGGAPGLEGPLGYISTSGCVANNEAWSAVALSARSVGVDLEPGPATEALTRWTLTEAYLKALGRGLAAPPDQVRVTPRDDAALPWRLSLEAAPTAAGALKASSAVIAAVAVLAHRP